MLSIVQGSTVLEEIEAFNIALYFGRMTGIKHFSVLAD
jgi:hypothetical protein